MCKQNSYAGFMPAQAVENPGFSFSRGTFDSWKEKRKHLSQLQKDKMALVKPNPHITQLPVFGKPQLAYTQPGGRPIRGYAPHHRGGGIGIEQAVTYPPNKLGIQIDPILTRPPIKVKPPEIIVVDKQPETKTIVIDEQTGQASITKSSDPVVKTMQGETVTEVVPIVEEQVATTAIQAPAKKDHKLVWIAGILLLVGIAMYFKNKK